jgi:type II secretory pathway component GspD/PulD (secretin)
MLQIFSPMRNEQVSNETSSSTGSDESTISAESLGVGLSIHPKINERKNANIKKTLLKINRRAFSFFKTFF